MTPEEKRLHLEKLKRLGYVKNGKVSVTPKNYYTVMPWKLKLHRKSPMHWLEERFSKNKEQFVWSEIPEYKQIIKDGHLVQEAHVWDGTPDPLYAAWQGIADRENIAVASATSCGKTYMIALIILWFMDVYDEAVVALSAPSFRLLKRTVFKEIKKHIPKFNKFYDDIKFNENIEITIQKKEKFINEKGKVDERMDRRILVTVTPKVADGDEVSVDASGLHSKNQLIIVEESSGVHMSILKSFISTSTGPNNMIALFGNPVSQTDTLYYFSQLPSTKSIIISALDHPNVVKQDPEYINGAVTQKSIDIRREEYGENHPIYVARVRGRYPKTSANSLISLESLNACRFIHPKCDDDHDTVIGIDVANSKEGDDAAYCLIEHNVVTKLEEFECQDASFIADTMLEDAHILEVLKNNYTDGKNRDYPLPHVDQYNLYEDQIIVDSVNVGISAINRFAALDYYVHEFYGSGKVVEELIPTDPNGRPLYHFANIRAQAFYLLKMDIDRGNISLNMPEETFNKLVMELINTRADINSSGNKFRLEPKKNIKKRLGRSPNLADSLMMANLLRNMDIEGLNMGGLGVHI
jgi:hypothetical protein